jgi:hypothetical protein
MELLQRGVSELLIDGKPSSCGTLRLSYRQVAHSSLTRQGWPMRADMCSPVMSERSRTYDNRIPA